MKRTLIAACFVAFSSNALASEGMPLWLASFIAWAQHQSMLARFERHERR